MIESAAELLCLSCDHEIVPGVACDGQYELCPYRPRQRFAGLASSHLPYRIEVVRLAQSGEFDAVRGDA
ncbi:MAG: hypothetical protein ABFS23_07495 [Pseudomonadota bacterium]